MKSVWVTVYYKIKISLRYLPRTTGLAVIESPLNTHHDTFPQGDKSHTESSLSGWDVSKGSCEVGEGRLAGCVLHTAPAISPKQ